MELNQLKYFCTVAEYQNMTKASNAIMVSQPSLSKAIKNLEDELGVLLFDRAGKYIIMNDVGKLFYSRIKECLKSIDDAADEVKDYANDYAGKICIVIKCGHILFDNIYYGFTKKYPKVDLEITNFCIFEQRGIEDFDFTVTASMNISPQMNVEPLLREDLVIVTPFDYKFSSLENSISEDNHSLYIRDLADEKFIGLWPGSNSGHYFSQLCHAAEISPKIIYRSKNLADAINRIEDGEGIGFMPYQTLYDIYIQRKLNIYKINDPGAYRIIKLVWSDDMYMSNAKRAFVAYVKKYFSSIKAQHPHP